MSKTNRVLLAVLVVLLLVLSVMGGVIATKAGLFESRTMAEPFNETRYSGTVDNAEGLTDGAVPVVLVIRFHEKGETGELTSPTLQRHSTLTRTGKNTYREDIVHGEGDSGTEWTFTPSKDDTLDVSYTTLDGASSTAQLPQTDPDETAGEVGINPNAPGTEPDGIQFPEPAVRTTGTLETAGTPEGEPTEVIFRWDVNLTVATITYPDRGCYGILEDTAPGIRTEKITVGDCPSGATWHFREGDPGGGRTEYTSPDGTRTESMNFSSTDWGIIDGEIGLSRSGPVLDFYRRFTETSGGEPVKGSCEPAAFDEVVEEWPTLMGTAVLFCDGTWATAGQNGTDFIGHFHFTNGQWEVIDYDGRSSVTRHHCFDHNKLRALGAPNDFLTGVLQCD